LLQVHGLDRTETHRFGGQKFETDVLAIPGPGQVYGIRPTGRRVRGQPHAQGTSSATRGLLRQGNSLARAHVPTCPRAHVPTCPRAHVPTCPRALDRSRFTAQALLCRPHGRITH
jgi:hypothetical protein